MDSPALSRPASGRLGWEATGAAQSWRTRGFSWRWVVDNPPLRGNWCAHVLGTPEIGFGARAPTANSAS
eukprot:705833-Alexandrium_andersonii.AAC.1